MTINLLGIYIAKSTFELHGADNSGKAVHKRRLSLANCYFFNSIRHLALAAFIGQYYPR